MDGGIGIRYKVDLERMLLDGSAEPTYLWLSLLEDITDCFSDDQQIGSGGFAVVYKGIVGERMVAVKKLSQTLDMHENKFHKEVECLMKAKHKNIVRFLGYCSDTQGRIANYEGKFVMADLRNWLLCFEYVPNGSLDKYITDSSGGLEWCERYQIIKGICEGLLHLHEKHILHLDLKPGNILIDDRMVPKIADFGLSRCLDKDQTRAFTSHLCGSQGYLAPEFYRGQVAFASDIYSLGVIIIEILTGEKGYPEDENVVENWMNRLEASDNLEMQLEQVRVCAKIGIECMDLNPKKRPVARCVNDRLDKTTSVVKTGISSSSVKQQVSFLKERYWPARIAKLSSEYLGKDIKQQAKRDELVNYVGTPREKHWHQGREEAPDDQWSLCGARDTKQNIIPQGASISCSNHGVLYKLNNLDIFNTKACKNYVKLGGPILENIKCVKLFKRGELKPILKDKNFIRKDGFGELYKGLVDNVPVMVRKLISDNVVENGDFANEVIMLSRVIHKNIIRLIGCCLEFDAPILVYEFFSTVSLHDILHINIKLPLNLSVRYNIVAALADALAYVHSAASTQILHCDLQPTNILFDDNLFSGKFVPKISGFGMSRMIARDIIGDMTYMDSIYLQKGYLTEQSDVYSFGVIILELLTRSKAIHADHNSLVRTFLENHKKGRKSTGLFDKEIALKGDLGLLDMLVEIAVKCLDDDVVLRPSMVDVTKCLSILDRSLKSGDARTASHEGLDPRKAHSHGASGGQGRSCGAGAPCSSRRVA
ncbi:uncharacterized protein [Triticum aestivum]|uniref:Protein kinase domain-containing protein n=1 Tax=Triticum aestivum TaxID=4565 RepID=A0A3B6NJL8_WHEAT|nr:uncharacterized protein LOC123131725 isoform X1 [Triticum aestivum]